MQKKKKSYKESENLLLSSSNFVPYCFSLCHLCSPIQVCGFDQRTSLEVPCKQLGHAQPVGFTCSMSCGRSPHSGPPSAVEWRHASHLRSKNLNSIQVRPVGLEAGYLRSPSLSPLPVTSGEPCYPCTEYWMSGSSKGPHLL